MQSWRHGPESQRNDYNSLWNPCHEESRLFEEQREVLPRINILFLIKRIYILSYGESRKLKILLGKTGKCGMKRINKTAQGTKKKGQKTQGTKKVQNIELYSSIKGIFLAFCKVNDSIGLYRKKTLCCRVFRRTVKPESFKIQKTGFSSFSLVDFLFSVHSLLQ